MTARRSVSGSEVSLRAGPTSKRIPASSPTTEIRDARSICRSAVRRRVSMGARVLLTTTKIRERVWELTIRAEQEKDPERKGVAILIDVDLIEELSGAVVMKRD